MARLLAVCVSLFTMFTPFCCSHCQYISSFHIVNTIFQLSIVRCIIRYHAVSCDKLTQEAQVHFGNIAEKGDFEKRLPRIVILSQLIQNIELVLPIGLLCQPFPHCALCSATWEKDPPATK